MFTKLTQTVHFHIAPYAYHCQFLYSILYTTYFITQKTYLTSKQQNINGER